MKKDKVSETLLLNSTMTRLIAREGVSMLIPPIRFKYYKMIFAQLNVITFYIYIKNAFLRITILFTY
jgi:hypothetical protein